jgi:2-polyprenyl-3-methyl-5-hydroxy-6-metoxy-1,4-benzoquinol methylase
MMQLKQQEVQEALYQFPYHYCVQFKDNFSLALLFSWGLNYASTMEFLMKKVAEDKNLKSIIDIGCGDGRFTRELFKEFSKVIVKGLDYSNRSIQLAKGLNDDLNIDFYCENIIENELSEKFSTAILMEVYEHIQPSLADHFLKGIYNLLEPGGVLHLTVPHENTPVYPHHFRHFNSNNLISELGKHFEIIEVIPFEKISYIRRKWLMRLFVNRYFMLNHVGFKNKLYKYYKKHLFYISEESQCQRIYVKCRKL